MGFAHFSLLHVLLFVAAFTETNLYKKNECNFFEVRALIPKDRMRVQGKSETSLQELPFIKFLWATLCPVVPPTGNIFVCELSVSCLSF